MSLDHEPDLANLLKPATPDAQQPEAVQNPATQDQVPAETHPVADQAIPEAAQPTVPNLPLAPNLPPPPNNTESLDTPIPKKKFIKPLAIFGAVAALTTGALAFNSRKTSDNSKPVATSVPDTIYHPESDNTVGKIRTAIILDTDRVIEAKRPNGDVIKVPAIRNTKDPYLLTNSVLANLACIMTDVGSIDNTCLNAFTNDQRTREMLIDLRDRQLMPGVLKNLNPMETEYTQAAFYDLPGGAANTPPQVSVDADGLIHLNITADCGILFNRYTNYAYANGHPDIWQGPATHQAYDQYSVSRLYALRLIVDPRGGPGGHPIVKQLEEMTIRA